MRFMMRTLNDYLRQKRIDSGLSQLDVARELGYASPQFVSNWERGLVSPPLETISTLIDLYKMPAGEVVERILDETRDYLEETLVRSRRRSQRSSATGRGKGGARKKSAARRENAHA